MSEDFKRGRRGVYGICQGFAIQHGLYGDVEVLHTSATRMVALVRPTHQDGRKCTAWPDDPWVMAVRVSGGDDEPTQYTAVVEPAHRVAEGLAQAVTTICVELAQKVDVSSPDAVLRTAEDIRRATESVMTRAREAVAESDASRFPVVAPRNWGPDPAALGLQRIVELATRGALAPRVNAPYWLDLAQSRARAEGLHGDVEVLHTQPQSAVTLVWPHVDDTRTDGPWLLTLTEHGPEDRADYISHRLAPVRATAEAPARE